MGSENTAIKMMTYISTSWIFSKTDYQYMYWYLVMGKTTPILVKTNSPLKNSIYIPVSVYTLMSVYFQYIETK